MLHLSQFVLAVAWCQKPGATGDLRIKSDQPGATVILDGKEVGLSPVLVAGLAAGKHAVQLRKDGYIEFSQELDFKPAKTASTLFAVLTKAVRAEEPAVNLPVKFDVVHLHSAGRCFGQLVVNRDVIEYESSDGKDSFQIPVRSLTMVARDGGNAISAWDIAGAVAGSVVNEAAGPPIRTNPQTGKATGIRTMPPVEVPDVRARPVDPAALLPVRLETNGRKYSFIVVEIRGVGTRPSENRPEVSAESTNRLFTVANQLYRDDLASRPGQRR
jgi:hypothetical protein